MGRLKGKKRGEGKGGETVGGEEGEEMRRVSLHRRKECRIEVK